jgi:hypothetical protein
MATTAIPPGGTLVSTFKMSFVDVPVNADKDNAISTTEFLDAAESLTSIFGIAVFPRQELPTQSLTRHPDVLGSLAFSPVKSDMIGNIKVK